MRSAWATGTRPINSLTALLDSRVGVRLQTQIFIPDQTTQLIRACCCHLGADFLCVQHTKFFPFI
jgi:hypothetical protein